MTPQQKESNMRVLMLRPLILLFFVPVFVTAFSTSIKPTAATIASSFRTNNNNNLGATIIIKRASVSPSSSRIRMPLNLHPQTYQGVQTAIHELDSTMSAYEQQKQALLQDIQQSLGVFVEATAAQEHQHQQQQPSTNNFLSQHQEQHYQANQYYQEEETILPRNNNGYSQPPWNDHDETQQLPPAASYYDDFTQNAPVNNNGYSHHNNGYYQPQAQSQQPPRSNAYHPYQSVQQETQSQPFAPPPKQSYHPYKSVQQELQYHDELHVGEDPLEEEKDSLKDEIAKLLQQIKDAGVAGAVSYAAWELAFWVVSTPLLLVGFNQFTGHWPDFSDQEDLSTLGAEVFAYTNLARFALPLRISLAISTAPWVQQNILDQVWKKKKNDNSSESSGSDDETDHSDGSVMLEYPEVAMAQYEQEMIQSSASSMPPPPPPQYNEMNGASYPEQWHQQQQPQQHEHEQYNTMMNGASPPQSDYATSSLHQDNHIPTMSHDNLPPSEQQQPQWQQQQQQQPQQQNDGRFY